VPGGLYTLKGGAGLWAGRGEVSYHCNLEECMQGGERELIYSGVRVG